MMRDDLIVQRRLTFAVWENRVRHGSSRNGFVEIAGSLSPFYLTTVTPVNRNSKPGRLHRPMRLIYSKQHGLELAGAVTGVRNEPMRPVRGDLRCFHARIDLPFEAPPAREQIEKDAKSENRYMQNRARIYLDALDAGNPRPVSLDYPLSVVRIGDDLTFVVLAGEVVVDYSLRLKRELRAAHPWLVGYAMEVPCYIPSKRILLEGGYEADSSLIYYGIYGPFKPQVEEILVAKVKEMVAGAKTK
jgi:neutral ceramidase